MLLVAWTTDNCDPCSFFDNRPITNCLGYIWEHSDKTIYYIIPKLFKEEVCKGFRSKVVREILKQKDMMDTYHEGGRDKKIILDGKRKRMVTIIVKNAEDFN